MEKLAKFIAVALMLIAMVSGVALAAEVLPTASLWSFDADTFTYVYRVICPENMTQPFGYFQVDAQVPELEPYVDEGTGGWILSGPFVDDEDQEWANGVFPWTFDPEKDSAYWRADRTQEIPAFTAWQGDFVLVVPNTQPGRGMILTKNGVPGSTQEFEDLVPCPIPEPSSLLALGAGLVGLGTCWKRRRNPKA